MLLTALLLAGAPAPAPAPPQAKPLPLCTGYGARPPECREPPLGEEIAIYGQFNPDPQPLRPEDGIPIRGPVMQREAPPVPSASFPAELRRGELDSWANVRLRVVVGADGKPGNCTEREVNARYREPGQKEAPRITLDPGIVAASCALVERYRRFRPGINLDGRAIAMPLDVEVYFARRRYSPGPVPAPPPPSRWLGSGLYSEDGYRDSHGFGPNQFAALGQPDFGAFLPDREKLPRKATVGLVIDFARDGKPGNCKVRMPSGDPRLDQASCAALMAGAGAPSSYGLWNAPLLVDWKKDKAQLRRGASVRLPALLAPVPIAEAQIPTGMPGSAITRVRVRIDPAGKALACLISWSTAPDAADALACRSVLSGGKFSGGTDPFGRPSLGGVELRVDWVKREILGSAY